MQWTQWTIRLALALFVLSLLGKEEPGRHPRGGLGRLAWTAGCLAYLLHVVCAFQFYHHWSHALAYQDTARRTEEVVGWSWGGGLYVNHVFTLVWVADVVWWWCSPESHARRLGLRLAVRGFMVFMAFNATVVFGQGIIRWLGLAGCLVLLCRVCLAGKSGKAGKMRTADPRSGGERLS
jgi:hypothetical protein